MQYFSGRLSKSLILSGSLSLALSCQAPTTTQPSPSNTSERTTSQTATKMRQVNFRIDPSWGFQIKQQAQPSYVRVRVHQGNNTSYFPENSDNGLITIDPNNSTVQVAVNVPEGTHWIIDVSFLYTPESEPVKHLKSQFDVPTTGDIAVNVDTYLLAAVVEALHQINPTKLEQLNRLNLKAYLDELTGFNRDPQTGNVTYTRLNNALLKRPEDISARQIAMEINAGTLTPISTVGQLTNPIDYLQTPALRGITKITENQPPVLPLAINKNNQMLFFKTIPAANSEVFSVTVDDQSTDTTSFFQHQLGSFNGALSLQKGMTASGKLDKQPFMAVGSANPSGGSLTEAAYLFELNTTGGKLLPTLRAINPGNGNTLWSFDFGDGSGDSSRPPVFETVQRFSPVIKHMKGNDLQCQCDDDNLVIMSIASTDSTKQGIYAFKQKRPGGIGSPGESTGELVWFHNQSGAFPTEYGAALSPDHERLYLIERENLNGVLQHYMVALNANTGAQVFKTPLAGFSNASTPSVGKNGTIYQSMNDNGDTKIHAIDPTSGDVLWVRSILDTIGMSPLVDHQNGQDVLYLWSWFSGKAYALYGNNTNKWTTPVTVLTRKSGESFDFSSYPVIGETPGGGRMLYLTANKKNNISLTSSKIYAVTDKGTQGEVSWSFSPGGSIVPFSAASSLTLHNHHLYIGTRDGGDGQFVNLRAIKVESPNMPTAAPWPRLGGNKKNQNVPSGSTP